MTDLPSVSSGRKYVLKDHLITVRAAFNR